MKHGYAFVTSVVLGLLLSLLLCAKCSPGQYQSPCQNGQCPPQYQQPVYQQPQQPTKLGEPTDVRIRVKAGGGYMSGSGTAFGHYQSGTLILTNHHVIEGGSSVVVSIGQREVLAKVLGSEPDPVDAAILWVPGTFDVVSVASDTPADAMAEFRAYDGGQHFRCWQGRILGFKYDSYLADTYSVGGNSGGGVYVNGQLVGVLWGNRDNRLAFTGIGPIRKLCGRLGIGIAAGLPQNITPVVPAPEQENPCPSCPQGSCDCDGKITRILDQQDKTLLLMEKFEQRIAILESKESEPGPAGPAGAQGIQGEQGPPGKDANTTNLEQRIAQLEDRKIKLEIYRDGELVGVSEGKSTVRVNIKQLEESLRQQEEN